MSRELTRDEQRRVTDLADFCISRLRPSREKCTALALLRLGEEGERPRELDRLIIDGGWSSEQAIGELNTFARESFAAVSEDARSYSEIQHYSIVAYDVDGKPLASRQLDITPELPDDGRLLAEPATDRGERRQLMRHTEEAFRLAERTSRDCSDRLARENERLANHSLAREAQLVTTTEKMCEMMIKFAEREHDRAKLDYEIEKQRRRDARIDRILEMGVGAIGQHYRLAPPQQVPVITPVTNGKEPIVTPPPSKPTNPMATMVALFDSMTPAQRVAMSQTLTNEQLRQLETAMTDYAKHSQETPANGATSS